MNDLKESSTEELRPFINRPLSSVRNKPFFIFVLGIFLTVLVSACANVDPKPFTKFNTAANGIRAIDTAVDSHVSSAKERDMNRISNNLNEINNLALEFDSRDPADDEYDPFGYKYKFTHTDEEPIFIKLQRLDSGLTELNSSFIEYTSLLAALADGDLIKTEDFDQLSEDLNNNLNSALKSLDMGVDASGLALFSTIAGTAAHAYISNKRKGYLIDILEDNQKDVDGFIGHAQNAIQIMRDEIIAEYESSRQDLVRKYPSSANKRLIANKYLANSEKTAAALEMFKALNNTYDALAITHKKLHTGLKNDKMPSFSDLRGIIKNVQKRYKDLKKANEEADKAAEGTPS